MDKLNDIWYYVENFGTPIIAIIGTLTFGSFIFYLREIKNLRLMEKQLKLHGTLKNYTYQAYTVIGLTDIFSAFRNLSKIETNFLKHRIFNEQVNQLKSYRRYYKIAVPTIIGLATIGIAINELIIDK